MATPKKTVRMPLRGKRQPPDFLPSGAGGRAEAYSRAQTERRRQPTDTLVHSADGMHTAFCQNCGWAEDYGDINEAHLSVMEHRMETNH